MQALETFIHLHNQVVAREFLEELLLLAVSDNDITIYKRVKKILETYPNVKEFEVVVKDISVLKKQLEATQSVGLNGSRHKGVYKEALNECGRLNKGYKFEKGGKIVKTKQSKKKKSQTAYTEIQKLEKELASIDTNTQEGKAKLKDLQGKAKDILDTVSIEDIKQEAKEHSKKYQALSDAFKEAGKKLDANPKNRDLKKKEKEAGQKLNDWANKSTTFNKLLKWKGYKGILVVGKYAKNKSDNNPQKKPVKKGVKMSKNTKTPFVLSYLPKKYEKKIYTSTTNELVKGTKETTTDTVFRNANKNMLELVKNKLMSLELFKKGYFRNEDKPVYYNIPTFVYKKAYVTELKTIDVVILEYLLKELEKYDYETAWEEYSFEGKNAFEIGSNVKNNITKIKRYLDKQKGLGGTAEEKPKFSTLKEVKKYYLNWALKNLIDP